MHEDRKEQRKKYQTYHTGVKRHKRTGFTPEMFKSALDKQGGRCGICGVLFDEKIRPLADHDHETRRARGLLCSRCNTAEGYIKNTGLTHAEWANRLQQYLTVE